MGTFVRGAVDEAAGNAEQGAEPTEEVGPEASEAKPGQCEILAGEMRGEQPGDAEFSIRSEIDEAFAPTTDVMVAHPDDGMPVPADETTELALAHPFTRETVVCIEDARSYVEVFEEERSDYEFAAAQGVHPNVDERLSPKLTYRSKYDDDGHEIERLVFPPAEVLVRWGTPVVRVPDRGSVPPPKTGEREVPMYVLVRPKRERCCYYKRQLFANDMQRNPKEPGHLILFENCTARRSVGGAFLRVADEAVYACDYRSPPDPATATPRLDEVQAKKLRDRPDKVHLPLFNLN